MNEREERFYRELASTPPVPAGLYGAIEGRIGRARRVRGGMMAAAALVLAVASMIFVSSQQGETRRTAGLDSMVVQELEEVTSYIHGTAIDSEIGMYAFVDWSETEVSTKEANR